MVGTNQPVGNHLHAHGRKLFDQLRVYTGEQDGDVFVSLANSAVSKVGSFSVYPNSMPSSLQYFSKKGSRQNACKNRQNLHIQSVLPL